MRQACGAFGGTWGPISTLLKRTPCIRMLWGGEEAVFVGRRLLSCQKRSCETPHRGTSSPSTLVEFVCIGKWPWTQFFFRACAVGWLIDVLLMLFPWLIVRNARRRRFGRVYLGRMAQKRCHSGCTIILFWFDSSRYPSVSLLRRDCSVLQANWQSSESGADFTFLGWLREVGDSHSCGFAYRYHCSSYYSFVALIAVPAVF